MTMEVEGGPVVSTPIFRSWGAGFEALDGGVHLITVQDTIAQSLS